MSTVTNVGDFKVTTHPNGVTISTAKNGEIFVTPGEREVIIKIISDSLKFSNMKLVPPKLTHEPFRVLFNEKNTCELVRLDTMDFNLKFTFEQGDDLLVAVSEGIDRHVEEETLSGGPVKIGRMYDVPEPTI